MNGSLIVCRKRKTTVKETPRAQKYDIHTGMDMFDVERSCNKSLKEHTFEIGNEKEEKLFIWTQISGAAIQNPDLIFLVLIFQTNTRLTIKNGVSP